MSSGSNLLPGGRHYALGGIDGELLGLGNLML